MGILTDGGILDAIAADSIVIEPFNNAALGSNSYDVHLGDTLLTYVPQPLLHSADGGHHGVEGLDCKRAPIDEPFFIGNLGFILHPGRLYLASTVEYTESHKHVPFLEGKSSLGRLGLSIHVTAGKGDVGFCGHWTMEMTVVHPLRVYAGMPIGQLIWFSTDGPLHRGYGTKPSAKYSNRNPLPASSPSAAPPSRMWRNFDDTKEND